MNISLSELPSACISKYITVLPKNKIVFLGFENIFCEMVNCAENKLKTIYSAHLKRGRNDTKVADILNMYS
jgi:hypothetical protein